MDGARQAPPPAAARRPVRQDAHDVVREARWKKDRAGGSWPRPAATNRARRSPRPLAAALGEHRHLRSARVLCQDDTEPLTRQIVQTRAMRAARKAGVAHCASGKGGGVHILRHTFCSHLAMRGAPARAIQELAGHMDLSMTQRYMHLSPAALDSAIRLLEQPAGPARSGHDAAEATIGLKDRGNRVATGGRT